MSDSYRERLETRLDELLKELSRADDNLTGIIENLPGSPEEIPIFYWNSLEDVTKYILMRNNFNLRRNISNRISMQEAYNTEDGPCVFRALLAIAETRTVINLTKDQLITARIMYFGSAPVNDWTVNINRSDVKTQGSTLASEDVIKIGLELLGSNEKAERIARVIPSPDDKKLPAGTQATLIQVSAASSSGHHFLEGDANGNMIYDPLNRIERYINRTITRFDAFIFKSE